MSAEQLIAVLIAFLVGMGVASVIISMWLYRRNEKSRVLPGSGLIAIQSKRTFWADFWHGVGTEMAGAIVTAVLFSVILRGAEQQQVIDERVTQLIVQLSSPDTVFALEAARQLQASGWLKDCSLKGRDLSHVYLEGMDLTDADLQATSLFQANLKGADLRNANLEGARLVNADLHGTSLSGANLEEANLGGANLEGAILRSAVFNERTWLPDGKPPDHNPITAEWIVYPESYYQPGVTDMDKYTNPNHPDFWQPEWVKAQQAEKGNDGA